MSEEKKWLIEDKFEDNEEGRKALIKSFNEGQGVISGKETKITELEQTLKGFDNLKTLDEFIKKDKQTFQFLEMRKDQLKNGGGSTLVEPQMPTDYDILDVGTPGTSSYKYQKEIRTYDKALLKQEMQTDFDAKIEKINSTITTNQQTTQSKQELHKELKGFGLDDVEIAKYEKFFADKENATVENTVKIFNLLTGKKVAISPEKLQKLGIKLSSIIPGFKGKVEEPNDESKKAMDELMEHGG